MDVLEGADHARGVGTIAAFTVREIISRNCKFVAIEDLDDRADPRNRVPVATLVGVAALPSMRACVLE